MPDRTTWPRRRRLAALLGLVAVAAAVVGPLAEHAHHDFRAHAVAHLLLGMVAPLLLVLAAPVTLALRLLPVRWARRLTWLLRLPPVRLLTEPAVAAVLSVGGAWLLYATPLFAHLHDPALHALVHVHVLVAGYLLTTSLVAVDPLPHRRPFAHRCAVLVLALAAHGILAKHLYARPPVGVPAGEAEVGSMIMYYGGDAVDLALLVLLWLGWWRSTTRTRTAASSAPAGGPHPPVAATYGRGLR